MAASFEQLQEAFVNIRGIITFLRSQIVIIGDSDAGGAGGDDAGYQGTLKELNENITCLAENMQSLIIQHAKTHVSSTTLIAEVTHPLPTHPPLPLSPTSATTSIQPTTSCLHFFFSIRRCTGGHGDVWDSRSPQGRVRSK